jgi:sorting nexin-1/2
MLDSVDLDDEIESPIGPRIPPPVQPSAAPARRDTQPSVSIEQAAKPSFDITVGDPHKVGDLTSSHTVYLVKTKVTNFCSHIKARP